MSSLVKRTLPQNVNVPPTKKPYVVTKLLGIPVITEEMKQNHSILLTVIQDMKSKYISRGQKLEHLENKEIDSYIMVAEYEKALELINNYIQIRINKNDLYTRRAVCNIHMNNPHEAMFDVNSVLKIDANNTEAILTKAFIYNDCFSDVSRAIDNIKLAYNIDPNNARIRMYASLLGIRMNNNIEQEIDINMMFLSAKRLYQCDKKIDSWKKLFKILNRDNTHVPSLVLVGDIYAESRNFEQAKNFYKYAYQFDNNYRELESRLAFIELRMGNYEKTMLLLDDTNKRRGESVSRAIIAIDCMIESGQHEQAFEKSSKLAEQIESQLRTYYDVKSFQYLHFRAVFRRSFCKLLLHLEDNSRFVDYEDDILNAVKIDFDTSIDVNYFSNRIKINDKLSVEAKNDLLYKIYESINYSSYPPTKKSLFMSNISFYRLHKGLVEQAEEAAIHAVDLDPNNCVAVKNLVKILYVNKKYSEMINVLRKHPTFDSSITSIINHTSTMNDQDAQNYIMNVIRDIQEKRIFKSRV